MFQRKLYKIALGILILLIVLFVLESIGIEWTKYFSIKRKNADREVFEQTKSYVHSKIQDLAKYYKEYTQAVNQDEKDALASVIQIQFAEFDADKISNKKLKAFLVNIRGY
jgi:hypothetical protein